MNLPNHFRGSRSCPRVLLACALGLVLALAAIACEPEEHDQPPPRPSIDDWRLGTFEMEVNGQRFSGDLTSMYRNIDQQNNPEAEASYSFIQHSDDLYERRNLLFYAKGKVGVYRIDTIRPDAILSAEWPYDEVLYHHGIEFGHAGGRGYAPILNDTIADFIAVDSIIGDVYHGRFQVSLVSFPEDRNELPDAPDTVIIRGGRFAIREYLREWR